ncbi:sugar phosphate isomerase/epimerase family protein [Solicola gregarius]|uniref:Sugar phosphate isomerase/epimerase n=1 Tax=Solicola gregarius TaxID=2908642 RepID=A0AA46TFJ8_9ACTN|nr:TIM barrel protein [Solicola gregarius]UYM03653.1 sugar phosphate isomerase/epimerase [Solicola gregarius]
MTGAPLCLWAGTLVGHDLMTRLCAAADAGYASMSASPAELAAAVGADGGRAVRAALDDTGLTLACLDPVVTWVPGAVAAHPAHRAHALVTVQTCLELAERFGIPLLNAVDVTWRPLGHGAWDGFAALAAAAATRGMSVAVEPQVYSGVPDVGSAMDLCSYAGTGTALLVDLWHLNRMHPPADLTGPSIAAVQVADGPRHAASDPVAESITARLAPGAGQFDLVNQLRTLRVRADVPIGPELFGPAVPDAAVAAHLAEALTTTRAVLADVVRAQVTPR